MKIIFENRLRNALLSWKLNFIKKKPGKRKCGALENFFHIPLYDIIILKQKYGTHNKFIGAKILTKLFNKILK